MAEKHSEARSVKGTKPENTSGTSPKARLKLSTKDGSELTNPDQIILALLGELQTAKFPVRIVNIHDHGEKSAAIIFPLRMWQ